MAGQPPERRPLRPANQRGVARLAAVQALYQLDIAGTTLAEVLAEFESFRLGREIDGEQYRDADAAYFREIVSGVVRDQRDLDPAVHGCLTPGWPLSRIDATLWRVPGIRATVICQLKPMGANRGWIRWPSWPAKL